MNLAYRDVRHNLFRFLLTCFGLSLLLSVVLAMIGIYRGIVVDALTVARNHRVDLWVVEAGSRGPFAEASRIPGDSREAIARLAGVTEAGSVTYQSVEAEHLGRKIRLYVIGFEPGRPGGPERIASGQDDRAKPFRDGRRSRDGPVSWRSHQARPNHLQRRRPHREPSCLERRPGRLHHFARCPEAAVRPCAACEPECRRRGEPQARARTPSMRWWRGSPRRPMQRPLQRRRDVGNTSPP